MIWIQPPGTPSMGHLYLDAYHATGDEYYYRAAEQVAAALAAGAAPVGRVELHRRLRGRDSRCASGTTPSARNAWRLEEFQHYYGNATFDDAGTAESAKFFLRLYVEKKDPKHKAPLDKAIRFVLDSQYPIGLWPQRFPRPLASRPARPAGLHRLRHVQRRCGGGEHGFPADVLPGAWRRAPARSDRPRHERVHRRRNWDRRSQGGACSTRST